MGTMFPGPRATVYKNEAGEVLGWDEGPEEPEYFDCCGHLGRCVCDCAWGAHDWRDAMTGAEVAEEDLDRVYEQRRSNHESTPLCADCKVRYDPIKHGEPLED